ncbi:MAG: hypothetical protein HN348_09885 [Proteobacteria bacterium]|nr:hypothetical protein [Pseudomonadota bacterium]
MRRHRMNDHGGLPPLSSWLRNLLIILFVMYVAELLLRNAGYSVGALEWKTFGHGFSLYALATRYFIVGRNAFSFVISLVVLYFFLPTVLQLFSRRQLSWAIGCGAIAGTLLGLGLDAIGLLHPTSTMGWSALVMALVLLFGLGAPNRTVHLFFAIPITASWFVWFVLVFAVLGLVFGRTLSSAEQMGTWLGVMGWYYMVGPGARRRHLRQQASHIEDELRRFTVIEGGRSDNRPPDDWVH